MKNEMLFSFDQYDGHMSRVNLSEVILYESRKDPYGNYELQDNSDVMQRQIEKLSFVNDFLLQKLLEAKVISGSDVKDLIMSITSVSDHESFKIERE